MCRLARPCDGYTDLPSPAAGVQRLADARRSTLAFDPLVPEHYVAIPRLPFFFHWLLAITSDHSRTRDSGRCDGDPDCRCHHRPARDHDLAAAQGDLLNVVPVRHRLRSGRNSCGASRRTVCRKRCSQRSSACSVLRRLHRQTTAILRSSDLISFKPHARSLIRLNARQSAKRDQWTCLLISRLVQ